MDDSPVNKANAFANAAEEFAERGQYANAVEAHFRAAELFLSAVSYTSDPEAVKTLKLLYANHTRQGKELQRRLQSRSPSSSLRPSPHTHPHQHHAAARQRPLSMPPPSSHMQPHQHLQHNHLNHLSMQRTASMGASELGSRHYFVGQSQSDSIMMGQQNHPSGMGQQTHVSQGPATMAVTSLDESDYPPSQMMDSVAQSYSVVSKGPEDDPDDPFNKFWEAVENLVEKISLTGPVAFATAPLTNSPQVQENAMQGYYDPLTQPPHHLSSSLRSTQMLSSYFVIPDHNTNMNIASSSRSTASMSSTIPYTRPIFYNNGGVVVSEGEHPNVAASIESNYFGIARSNSSVSNSGSGLGSASTSSAIQNSHSTVLAREYGHLPPRPPPSPFHHPPKTHEELVLENAQLKQTVDTLARQVAFLERAAEENNLLKSSIIQFRQDVMLRGRGKRRGGGDIVQGRALGRSEGGGMVAKDEVGALQARVRELEEELRKVKEEGDRTNTAMAKYKERWDKLKESAKRKKEAAGSGVTRSDTVSSSSSTPKPSPSPTPQQPPPPPLDTNLLPLTPSIQPPTPTSTPSPYTEPTGLRGLVGTPAQPKHILTTGRRASFSKNHAHNLGTALSSSPGTPLGTSPANSSPGGMTDRSLFYSAMSGFGFE